MRVELRRSLMRHSSSGKHARRWSWTPIKAAASPPPPSQQPRQTLFALQPKSPKLSPPRTRVTVVVGLTSSVKRVARMVFKRDHSTVAAGESPKPPAVDGAAAADADDDASSDSKKLRPSSPSPDQQLQHDSASPARSSSSPSPSEQDGITSSTGGGVTSGPELPEFLTLDRISITKKFKLLEARQRERVADGLKHGAASPFFVDDREHATSRNRYANIYVWDSTRIKLGIDAADNDYINASRISLQSPSTGVEKRYIATQGPKQDQARHLWLMALEQMANNGVIVMLTRTFEMGREKCFEYFPLDMDAPTRRFDRSGPDVADPFNFEITLLDCTYDEEARTEVRKIEIKVLSGTHTAAPPPEDPESFIDGSAPHTFAPELKPGDTKIIHHLLFKGWPDWNVPEGSDSDALLKLVELANRKNEAAEGTTPSPMIVHCSAGVGRSGTFIALDHLLAEIERGTYDADTGDPIFELVDRLREQRMYMVQSESQYEYLYRIMREKFELRLGILPGTINALLTPAWTPGGLRTPSLRTLSRKPSLEPVPAK
ncbi:Tyrosine-protein phosphatase [Drechslerella dactyloides]|uniref:Tyrosine-protein phosphatase n=1 Tax=Drechslerella dactyloides TaxID=74499 RepID=A0AAD6J884_DREDA|nr:Tyrosine-protein phosphatase [Drechslerella dactyloides]